MLHKTVNLSITILLLFLININNTLRAEISVFRLIGDHMILQRNVDIPIWGWADVGEEIIFTFNGKTERTTTNELGEWMIKLPAMEAGGPFRMRISGLQNTINIKNILIGDVWICSGQSNMEWKVEQTINGPKEIASARDIKIRHFKIPHTNSDKKEKQLSGGTWEVCSPKTLGDFSAVAYYFAKEVRKKTGVPIGLVNATWGGSRIESWMSAESLGYKNAELIVDEMVKERELQEIKIHKQLKEKLGDLPKEDVGIVAENAFWAANDFDDTNWMDMELPTYWENKGWEGFDGFAWFRKEIELNTEDLNNENILLNLGPIDDADQTWINGHFVGETKNGWIVNRQYKVDRDYLVEGKNVITVRVEDIGQGGGICGKENQLFLSFEKSRKINLAGNWKCKVGAFVWHNNTNVNHVPSVLYNAMIHPLHEVPMAGVIWYQGESNAIKDDAYIYRELFPKLIKDWRLKWQEGDFPFLFVQLANFMKPDIEPKESHWAMLRESQSKTLALPNTGQAVLIDIGKADDIHPRNKKEVGHRLALAALKIKYKQDVISSGPVFKTMQVEKGRIRLRFVNTGSGLHAKDRYEYLRGFAVAGADKKFHWAQAHIQGDEIIVYCKEVQRPIAVRYAWGDNPEDANLYNKEGLPASPFRTDTW